jgi:hypothetical protein
MKKGDLVLIDHYHPGDSPQSYGIYIKDIQLRDPRYSPSFPTCEIITSNGLQVIGVERIHVLL